MSPVSCSCEACAPQSNVLEGLCELEAPVSLVRERVLLPHTPGPEDGGPRA